MAVSKKVVTRNKKVDAFLRHEKRWNDELSELREIALTTGLDEDFKWMHPCYTLDNKNVFLIHGFKEYCALLFMKGAIMKDPKKLLIQQSANVQAGRQLRFTSLAEIKKQKALINSYMKDAIALEEAGLVVPVVKAKDFVIPQEIEKRLKETAGLWPAFKKLTPGRQRGYVHFFTSAKQEKTVIARIEKAMPAIFEGKGLNE